MEFIFYGDRGIEPLGRISSYSAEINEEGKIGMA